MNNSPLGDGGVIFAKASVFFASPMFVKQEKYSIFNTQ